MSFENIQYFAAYRKQTCKKIIFCPEIELGLGNVWTIHLYEFTKWFKSNKKYNARGNKVKWGFIQTRFPQEQKILLTCCLKALIFKKCLNLSQKMSGN